MIMSNKFYDALRILSEIILPAIGTLYAALAKIWGVFPYPAEVVATIVAVDTFLGAIVQISKWKYNQQHELQPPIESEE